MEQLISAVKAISVVTIGEMRSGAIEARWGEARRKTLEEFLRTYLVIPIDLDVAEEWARLHARCRELGRSKRDNDLWIAATAARHAIAVATLDADHHDIPGLAVIREDGTEISVPR